MVVWKKNIIKNSRPWKNIIKGMRLNEITVKVTRLDESSVEIIFPHKHICCCNVLFFVIHYILFTIRKDYFKT